MTPSAATKRNELPPPDQVQDLRLEGGEDLRLEGGEYTDRTVQGGSVVFINAVLLKVDIFNTHFKNISVVFYIILDVTLLIFNWKLSRVSKSFIHFISINY